MLTDMTERLNQMLRGNASNECDSAIQPIISVPAMTDHRPPALGMQIAWIDSYSLTRECILRAMSDLQLVPGVLAFASVKECMDSKDVAFDLIILYSHSSYEVCIRETELLREAFQDARLIMLSDLEDSHQLNTIRGALKAGANGFISTRTTGLSMTLSAIRFVQAGGTFAPLEVLLSEPSAPVAAVEEPASPYRLTARQKDVLAQLQQGRANKIIAHELGMSESTAKVHIRNIMRKMGATNRTQAAFNALKFCPDNVQAMMAAD
jgi:DNA-binding NarL/FixJ family response regulator